MNLLSPSEREQYLSGIDKELAKKKFDNAEIVLCPPFVQLEEFSKWKNKKVHPVKSDKVGSPRAKFNGVKIGAQNIFFEDKGSFTGEISPMMLKNFGCEFVIVGHSERRRYFGEAGEFINHKIISALKNGLRPVLCVGETKAEKDSDRTMEIITRQVKEALININKTKAGQLIIAYEPIWSVGTDVLPTSNEVMGAKLLIRKILHELFGKKYALEVAILYGGSVNSKSVKQVCIDSEVDGALIGRESLQPHEFVKIIEIINNN